MTRIQGTELYRCIGKTTTANSDKPGHGDMSGWSAITIVL